MIDQTLVNEITHALDAYRQSIARASDAQSKEDYSRLVAITERVITSIQVNDMADIKLGVLSFSRQVSDSFSTQPPEFKALAHKIAEVKRLVI